MKIALNNIVLSVILLTLMLSCYNYDPEESILTIGDDADPWAVTYGGGGAEVQPYICRTTDGRYMFATTTYSFGTVQSDIWVVKIYGDGGIIWQRRIRGSGADTVNAILPTDDGGAIIAGSTNTADANDSDFLVIKFDANGIIEWQRSYGEATDDIAYSICFSDAGGYMVTGSMREIGIADDSPQCRVIQIASDGTLGWERVYSGTGRGIRLASDGGYIVAGDFASGLTQTAIVYAWVMRINPSGAIIWRKTFDGAGRDFLTALENSSDGGYVLTGYSTTFSGSDTDYDMWIFKLDSEGEVAWEYSFDYGAYDFAYGIFQSSDGRYVVAGSSSTWFPSYGGTGGTMCLLKLNLNGSVYWQKAIDGAGNDLAYSCCPTGNTDIMFAGISDSFGSGGSDVWVLRTDSSGGIEFGPASGAVIADTDITPVNVFSYITIADINITISLSGVSEAVTTITTSDTDSTVLRQAP